MRPIARIATAALITAAIAGQADAASKYDGDWTVVMRCPKASDGARPFTISFPATVTNGQFHGLDGQPGQPRYLTLDGTIESDGGAILVGRGLTGDSDYVQGRLQPGRPFTYSVRSQFQERRGTGTRIELRPCEYDFIHK